MNVFRIRLLTAVVVAASLAASTAPALAKPAGKASSAETGLTGMWVVDTSFAESNQRLTMPLTPAGEAVKQANLKALAAGNVIGSKTCAPNGMPSMMVDEFALEFLETPGRVTILNEAATLPRSIYLDEKIHTPDLEPSWNGHSIGHWEGKTLVIDTINFNDRGALFGFVGVHSPTTHLVERYHVENGGQKMTGSMTFEDPTYLTKPFTATVTYHRLPPHSELWEYACETSGGWVERFKGDPEAKTPSGG